MQLRIYYNGFINFATNILFWIYNYLFMFLIFCFYIFYLLLFSGMVYFLSESQK